MSDEEKKIEETKVEEAQNPKTENQNQTGETAKEKTKEPEELVITEEVDQAAEVAAKPEATDTSIPEAVEGEAEKVELPNRDIKPGMWVRVHEKIKETNARGEEKERVQVFEGIVIGLKSPGISRTMTVRKNSKGWMVEKIWPLASPTIEKIEVVKQYKTKRAKMNYLRDRFRRKLKETKK